MTSSVAMAGKKIEDKYRLILQSYFYVLVSAWLLTSVLYNLVLNHSESQILSLDFVRSISPLYYVAGLGASLLLTAGIFLIASEAKTRLYLSKLILLFSLWLFLIHLWYIVYFIDQIPSSIAPSIGLVILSITVLVSTGYYLLEVRERKVLYYLSWFLYVIGILFLLLVLIDGLMLFSLASIGSDTDLITKVILSVVLAVQGALAGVIIAHLFPDISVINRPFKTKINSNRVFVFITIAFILHIFLFGYLMFVRTYTLETFTYDLGIFAQMFHNMAETGLPTTTLERSWEMSHFSVHVSPIYYLMLPLYYISRSAIALQLAQIVIVASGVLPLILITGLFGWPQRRAGVFSLLYLTYPAIIGSSMFDLHENCFLAPLLLWLLYFVLKKHTAGTFLFTVLVLSVKEDAALYIVFVALWMLLSCRTNKKHGAVMLSIALAWFALALYWLNTRGVGSMEPRYSNLMAWPEYGLLGAAWTSFLHPAYTISRIFTAEKIVYVITVLAPLAFLPVIRRLHIDYILIFPWIIMNLISDYPYQHNINFQYHYGSGVLLIFAAMLAFDGLFKDNPGYNVLSLPRQARLRQVKSTKRKAVPFQRQYASKSYQLQCMTAGIILVTSLYFGAMIFAEHYVPLDTVRERVETASEMKREMDQIPNEASVRASTWLTTYLAQREKLIDLDYEYLENAEIWQADYIVIDQRYDRRQPFEDRIMTAIAQGYLVKVDLPEKILILQRPGAVD